MKYNYASVSPIHIALSCCVREEKMFSETTDKLQIVARFPFKAFTCTYIEKGHPVVVLAINYRYNNLSVYLD